MNMELFKDELKKAAAIAAAPLLRQIRELKLEREQAAPVKAASADDQRIAALQKSVEDLTATLEALKKARGIETVDPVFEGCLGDVTVGQYAEGETVFEGVISGPFGELPDEGNPENVFQGIFSSGTPRRAKSAHGGMVSRDAIGVMGLRAQKPPTREFPKLRKTIGEI